MEANLAAQLLARGDEVVISGEAAEVKEAVRVLGHLCHLATCGAQVSMLDVNYALAMRDEQRADIAEKLAEVVFSAHGGKQIKAKTFGQWQYLQNIYHNDMVFGIGPAGTGKTYLAVIAAVAALKKKRVSRIVLTRPAVEAGEKLGFLPGDLQEKVDPYLRPLYDALYDALGFDNVKRYMERGVIEVAPLAYMRGRTLDDAFIILDEAQNTTGPQMQMFLTRLGLGSKMVITGDITQVDLPHGQKSGLVEAQRRLHKVKGVAFSYLTKVDVVRHPLVQRIIAAYEDKEQL